MVARTAPEITGTSSGRSSSGSITSRNRVRTATAPNSVPALHRPIAGPLAGVIALGSIGLCSAGTLFGAVAVRTRFREVMLPLLLLPLLVPVISGAVRATAALLEGAQELPFEPIQLLIVTDTAYLILGFVGFEYVLDE